MKICQVQLQLSEFEAYQCNKCDFAVGKKKELKSHMKIVHKAYQCNNCDFAVDKKKELKSHMKIVHKNGIIIEKNVILQQKLINN